MTVDPLSMRRGAAEAWAGSQSFCVAVVTVTSLQRQATEDLVSTTRCVIAPIATTGSGEASILPRGVMIGCLPHQCHKRTWSLKNLRKQRKAKETFRFKSPKTILFKSPNLCPSCCTVSHT